MSTLFGDISGRAERAADPARVRLQAVSLSQQFARAMVQPVSAGEQVGLFADETPAEWACGLVELTAELCVLRAEMNQVLDLLHVPDQSARASARLDAIRREWELRLAEIGETWGPSAADEARRVANGDAPLVRAEQGLLWG